MKKNLILAILALVVLNTACAPVYRCGEAKPAKKNILQSKRMKAVIAERDTLCSLLDQTERMVASLQTDTVALHDSIDNLKSTIQNITAKHNRLQSNYEDLQNEKLSEAEKFNKALQQKSDELNQKEKLIAEREKNLQELQKNLRDLQQVIARQDSASKRLNDILRNALTGFKSDELSVEMKNGKVYVSMTDKLLFKSGSAAVEDKGKDALKVLADVLKKNPDVDILVEGHTDNVPIKTAIFKDNWDLSVARATSIVRILTDDYNLVPTRLTASGRGEYFPKASNDTAEGRAKNRRTEIILSPKLDELMKIINNK